MCFWEAFQTCHSPPVQQMHSDFPNPSWSYDCHIHLLACFHSQLVPTCWHTGLSSSLVIVYITSSPVLSLCHEVSVVQCCAFQPSVPVPVFLFLISSLISANHVLPAHDLPACLAPLGLFACLGCLLGPDYNPVNLNIDLVKSLSFNVLCLSVLIWDLNPIASYTHPWQSVVWVKWKWTCLIFGFEGFH